MTESWEMMEVTNNHRDYHKMVADLLKNGWEPFAVVKTERTYGPFIYYFKRKVVKS